MLNPPKQKKKMKKKKMLLQKFSFERDPGLPDEQGDTSTHVDVTIAQVSLSPTPIGAVLDLWIDCVLSSF